MKQWEVWWKEDNGWLLGVGWQFAAEVKRPTSIRRSTLNGEILTRELHSAEVTSKVVEGETWTEADFRKPCRNGLTHCAEHPGIHNFENRDDD